MHHPFVLSCESTVDMPFSAVSAREIPVLFYSYTVNGAEYADDMLRDPEALGRFYGFLDGGALPATSQINPQQYTDFFEKLAADHPGRDLLHIAFGSGMSNSVLNAQIAADEFRAAHPDVALTVVDSTCASSGYGLLVDSAADLRDAGRSAEEIADWLETHKRLVHHQFFSTDMKFFRRSGRVSGAAAAAATILGICPLMRLDYDGRIVAYDKVRGKKNAVGATVRAVLAHAEGGRDYAGKCFISHSNCLSTALETRALLEKTFPALQGAIPIYDIGTIIASHSGPGTVAVYFLGDERPR
ncbi:MAG: DegV family protein [Oscillospiraceae bacterium]|nr:DegV family protein [Oscillospiraceae bacterium]